MFLTLSSKLSSHSHLSFSFARWPVGASFHIIQRPTLSKSGHQHFLHLQQQALSSHNLWSSSTCRHYSPLVTTLGFGRHLAHHKPSHTHPFLQNHFQSCTTVKDFKNMWRPLGLWAREREGVGEINLGNMIKCFSRVGCIQFSELQETQKSCFSTQVALSSVFVLFCTNQRRESLASR